MDFTTPQELGNLPSGAPALNRGLAIMALLNQNSPLSLETLGSLLGFPKASLFRLLQTLQETGMIRKNADKGYEPLWTLSPLHDEATRLRQKLETGMSLLAAGTGCTAEWYEPCAEGMKLILQSHPETEVRVQARPGFIREWKGEFEAVTRLGHAFCRSAPALSPVSFYASNGLMKTFPAKVGLKQIALDTSRHTATDPAFNPNGVRRCASAAHHHKKFLGVLALAETYHFKRTNRTQALLAELQKIIPRT